ncbi:MAG: flagellar hook-associated protein FlgK [Betaproteobacteria bacterium]|nr:flagellar hook-associated protein FlgK [Betaproteobacteria bacterium]
MSGLINTGISALNAAQYGVLTAGHNIANANTPGFSREITEQKTNTPLFTGAGYVGQGVAVSAVRRIYDDFLAQQTRQAQSESSSLSTYQSMLDRVNNMLADPAAGLSPALNAFFTGLQAVAASPSDASARQSLLSNARALAGQFNSLEGQLSDLRSAANRGIESSASLVNALTRQIAALNDRIATASALSAGGQAPNDLLDQRDTLVADLNKELRVDIVKASDGSYSLFLASGQAVVLGNNAYALSSAPDIEDQADTQVMISIGGMKQRVRPEDLTGGHLGGYVAFRQEGLTEAQNALGRIAIAVAGSINDQHRLGQDLDGALGADLFTAGSPTVQSISDNTGSGIVSAAVSSYGALTTSDYRLLYDGIDYTLTRLSDGRTQAFGSLPQTVDGLTISLSSGSPSAGDRFLIKPTRAGARDFSVAISDLRSIAAAAPMRTASGLNNGGTGTISAGSVNAPPPPNANLRQSVTVTFTSATTFNVSGTGTNNPTGVAYTPGADISYNGWTVQIAGSPGAGDSFSIVSNANGAGDNRNARLLAGLQTQNLVGNGSATLQGAYAQLASQVGSKGRELQLSSQAQASLAAAAEKSQSAVSGVNLDEEASNLIRYQQAYQAAGKMIGIAGTLFDTILNLRT